MKERVNVWLELERFADGAIARGRTRLRERFVGRVRRVHEVAERLRRRRPRCRACGTHVERLVVIHEPPARELTVVAECHGATQCRIVRLSDLEGAWRSRFDQHDWLTARPFA